MTKTYELPNEKMIMADVDEKHHTATISVYALDDLVEAANKADVLDKIRAEINGLIKYYPYPVVSPYQTNFYAMLLNDEVLQIIDKYRSEVNE